MRRNHGSSQHKNKGTLTHLELINSTTCSKPVSFLTEILHREHKEKKMQAFITIKGIHILFFLLICGQNLQSINATKICTDSRSEELFADLVCKYTFNQK